MARLSTEAVRQELQRADDIFKSTAGIVPKYFRYPFGSAHEGVDRIVGNEFGKVIVRWNVDSYDWRVNAQTRSPAYISGNVIWQGDRLPNEGLIVLQHDVFADSVEEVPRIIQWARRQNKEFVTIAECLGGVAGVANQSYTEKIDYVKVPDPMTSAKAITSSASSLVSLSFGLTAVVGSVLGMAFTLF